MNFGSKLFFLYAESLGYLQYSQIMQILRSKEPAEYISRQNLLTPLQTECIKLLCFKHHLLSYAVRAGFFTNEQSEYLLQRKVEEIKSGKQPVVLQCIQNGNISAQFLQRVLDNLDTRGIFHHQDFCDLAKTILALPPNIANALKVRCQKSSVTPELQEYNIYEAICECGYEVRVEAKQGGEVRVYCKRCESLMVEISPIKKIEASKKMPLAPAPRGQAFAHYMLLEKIGGGAMGKVYRAIDSNTQEEVAIKILQAPGNEKTAHYFAREVEILQQLQHPNIISLKEWGTYKGNPYFAMEYMPGRDLLQLLERGGLTPLQAARIIYYALEALTYAHNNQVIHRDIKPANIFIGKGQVVKLIDLGIAKVLEGSDVYTHTGQIMGSGYYMAPEQIQDSKHINHLVDIYAVGATLYHAVCGVPPYGEYTDNIRKLFWAKLNDSYIRLPGRGSFPPKIIAIVETAMAQQPANRYQSATDMAQELLDFLQSN